MTGRHARRVDSEVGSLELGPVERSASGHSAEGAEDPIAGSGVGAEDAPQPTILEQLGGIKGMIYSVVPVVLFVIVNSLSSLRPALYASVGVAVLIAIWRLVRREPLQPAISGLFAVGIGALIAHHTGQARDFFLLGIWYSGFLGVVFLVSALAGWPLAGVIWHGINGDGQSWRSDRALRRAYTFATLLWAVMFGVKFFSQHWLYDANQPGWLAVARIGGYALTGLALLGTFWATRRARSADSLRLS